MLNPTHKFLTGSRPSLTVTITVTSGRRPSPDASSCPSGRRPSLSVFFVPFVPLGRRPSLSVSSYPSCPSGRRPSLSVSSCPSCPSCRRPSPDVSSCPSCPSGRRPSLIFFVPFVPFGSPSVAQRFFVPSCPSGRRPSLSVSSCPSCPSCRRPSPNVSSCPSCSRPSAAGLLRVPVVSIKSIVRSPDRGGLRSEPDPIFDRGSTPHDVAERVLLDLPIEQVRRRERDFRARAIDLVGRREFKSVYSS